MVERSNPPPRRVFHRHLGCDESREGPSLAGKEQVEWSNGRPPLPEEYFTGIWDVTNHTRAPRWREPSQAVVCKISFKRGSTIRPSTYFVIAKFRSLVCM